jgi:hypothetical protein
MRKFSQCFNCNSFSHVQLLFFFVYHSGDHQSYPCGSILRRGRWSCMMPPHLPKDEYMLCDSSKYIFRSIGTVLRARLPQLFIKFTRMSALYQRLRSGCACCKAESLTSHHDPRRMRASSPIQSGLPGTAQHFSSETYAGDNIGFVMMLLTIAFCEFPDSIKHLANRSRDVVHREPAERASGS